MAIPSIRGWAPRGMASIFCRSGNAKSSEPDRVSDGAGAPPIISGSSESAAAAAAAARWKSELPCQTVAAGAEAEPRLEHGALDNWDVAGWDAAFEDCKRDPSAEDAADELPTPSISGERAARTKAGLICTG
eukprot:scaffold100881_cov28-Tisochrysis_lutea.AAC.6